MLAISGKPNGTTASDIMLSKVKLTDLYNPNNLITQNNLQGKISVVNIFGSWCTGCLVEHKHLFALNNIDGIQIIGINWQDTEDEAKRFLQSSGNPYDIVTVDESGSTITKLGFIAAPETYIIGPDLRVVASHRGILTKQDINDTILPVINTLKNAQ